MAYRRRPRIDGEIINIKQHKLIDYWMHVLAIVKTTKSGVRTIASYVVGIELATITNWETYNLYRSLARRGITAGRVSPKLLEQLITTDMVKRGTHSATLVPFEAALTVLEEFVRDKNDKDQEQSATIETWNALLAVIDEETITS